MTGCSSEQWWDEGAWRRQISEVQRSEAAVLPPAWCSPRCASGGSQWSGGVRCRWGREVCFSGFPVPWRLASGTSTTSSSQPFPVTSTAPHNSQYWLHEERRECTRCVWSIKNAVQIVQIFSLKLVCNLAEGFPIKCLFFLNEPTFDLLPGCSWLWCGLRIRGRWRKGTVPFLLLCYCMMFNREESGIPLGLMTYELQHKIRLLKLLTI